MFLFVDYEGPTSPSPISIPPGAPGLAAFARPGDQIVTTTVQAADEPKLQRLYGSGERRPLWFAQQQMNVLGHDYVAQDNQAIAAPHSLQNVEE